MIHSLWPTDIYQGSAHTELLLPEVLKLMPPDQELRDLQSIRPWCTDDLCHERREFSEVCEEILTQANALADHWGWARDELYITSMWANAQYQRQNHTAHHHPNSLISGVLYLQVPEHSQVIVFYDPRPQSQVIKPHLNTDTSIVGFHPQAGDLYMWPAWLAHSTQSVTVEELAQPRITLSWNIQLRADIRDHSARWHLK